MTNSTKPNDTILPIITTTALILGTTISLLQLDPISRRILSPTTTYNKRRNEVLYKLKEYVEKSWFLHRKALHEIEHGSNVVEYSIDKELLDTQVISKDEDVEGVILDILGDGKETSTDSSMKEHVEIIAIDQEKNMEYYIYLSLPTKEGRRRVQILLTKFSTAFKRIFEEKVITNTALCFISDASGGLSNNILGNLLSNEKLGLGVVMEPLWMLHLALLAKDHTFSNAHLESIVFSLCRLQAWNLRHVLGTNRTVVFFLPGQTTVSILTPLLQKVFRHERHVYSYDTCYNSMSRALHGSTTIASFTSVTNIFQTSPFLSNKDDLQKLLSSLPSNYANTLESWMNSVDTFLVLKEDENKNGYLPFTLRLTFLCDKVLTQSVKYDGDSYIIFCHFLQFVTGTRSRPLQDTVLHSLYDEFIAYLKQNPNLFCKSVLTNEQESIMEQSVFLHKRILIQSKTLLDTVLPKKDWSLKAAKKLTGCACCAPEEEDEEEDAVVDTKSPFSLPGSASDVIRSDSPKRSKDGNDVAKKKPRSKYMDGKMGFAFDPTAFS